MKNYWLHRVSYENGTGILAKDNLLTIGFSNMATPITQKAISEKNYDAFAAEYLAVYEGKISRIRNNLWNFAARMSQGDIVVVPIVNGFKIVEISGEVELFPSTGEDLGWQHKVKVLADISPRDSYASSALLSRMKCRNTNLEINDLKADVDDALLRWNHKKPFDLIGELAPLCLEVLKRIGSPDKFENIVRKYFEHLGANSVQILPKNSANKKGDCDVEAIFDALNLTISVQVKYHVGKTDEWSIQQIQDYWQNEPNVENMTWARWVISSADDFSDKAKEEAQKNNVILINGSDFSKMILRVGLVQ
jgi:predicted Mrr-cat superfamily restriction endonuclease